MDNRWYCDGKYLPSKCLGGIEDCDKSKAQERLRCVQCDYDLFEKFMNN